MVLAAAGRRLTGRRAADLVLVGAVLVVLNGIPGVTAEIVPRWRGDLLLVQPVAGALLGVLVLGEPPTAFTVVGGGLIVGGLWLTAKR